MSEIRDDYSEFLAKQARRKAESLARITAPTETVNKEVSSKYVSNNLKVIAGFTVGSVQQISNAKDVAVVNMETGKMPPIYLYPQSINAIQGITKKDYVLSNNFVVYSKMGDPNKLIIITKKENISISGLAEIALQNGSIQLISNVKELENSGIKLFAKENNAMQVITAKDDISYILVKGEGGEEEYVLADNFEVYNKSGEPNKIIVITTKDEVLNVPVVEEESSSSSSSESSEESSSSESSGSSE